MIAVVVGSQEGRPGSRRQEAGNKKLAVFAAG
jgi:hypothetical protein